MQGEFLYLGKAYKLELIDKPALPLTFDDSFKLSRDYVSAARHLFIRWYREKAQTNISERAVFYSGLSGLKFNRLRIKDGYSRWGSCSSLRNLNFSWRLIMAPQAVIDYVVAHELAHLAERNHSKKFWLQVAELFPEYEPCKKWLKKNGHLLRF